MLRIPCCLDIRFTDGGEVVSITHLPRPTPQKQLLISVSGTLSCFRLSKPQRLVRSEGLDKLIEFNNFVESRNLCPKHYITE
jgi:hypothetical protein